MGIVAATRPALSGDRLSSWVDTAYVGTHRTPQALGIARTIGVDVFEVIQLLDRDSSLGAVGLGRQYERNAVAPPAAHLRGEQLRIDLVFVRLQEILESDYVRLGHFEDCKTPVEPKFVRLRHKVVLGIVEQHKEPGFAWLLVVRRGSFGAAAAPGPADPVGVTTVRLGFPARLAVVHFV